MLGGMFVLESSSILFAFGTNYWVLLIARMLQGFSSGVTWCAGFAMIANAFPSEQQGTIIGYITVGNGVFITYFLCTNVFSLACYLVL